MTNVKRESITDLNFSTRFKNAMNFELITEDSIKKECLTLLKDYFDDDFLNELK